ncbi:MFS transporter [Streptacidiphilus sp. PAMC 29251]
MLALPNRRPSRREIKEPQRARHTTGLDIPGIILASSGLAALVYGFSKAQSAGWSAVSTLGFITGGVVLLAVFVLVQVRSKSPLLPLRVVLDRNRGGAYLTLGISVVGMLGAFLFLTYYLQEVLGYSPLLSGLAFLPMVVGMVAGSTQVAVRLLPRIAPRLLMAPGAFLAACAMLLLTQISAAGSYTTHVLPALLMLGFGMGLVFMPAMNLATLGVQRQDAGVASAMVSTSQQIGGAIGTSLLSTIANSATTTYTKGHAATVHSAADATLLRSNAMVHGFTTAYWLAAALLALAALSAALLINTGPLRGQHGPSDDSKARAHDTGHAVPTTAH